MQRKSWDEASGQSRLLTQRCQQPEGKLSSALPIAEGIQMAAINVRCLEDADLETLPAHHFDGKNL